MDQTANNNNRKLEDGLGDWRFREIHKVPYKGNWGVLTAFGELQAPNGDTFAFTDFMAAALYLNVAIAADEEANELRPHIHVEEFESRSGPYKTITHENLGTFFDFIEQSTIAVIFSFQALEAYCNFVIQFKLGDTGKQMFRCPRGPKVLMDAEEIQQCGPTLEKLKKVVPQLLKVPPPTKEPFWMTLCALKDVRDALTHLKYKDQVGAATAAASNLTRTDPEFVFYRPVAGEIQESPRTAVEVLDYFTRRNGTPRWLRYPLSVYGIVPPPPKGTTTITVKQTN